MADLVTFLLPAPDRARSDRLATVVDRFGNVERSLQEALDAVRNLAKAR